MNKILLAFLLVVAVSFANSATFACKSKRGLYTGYGVYSKGEYSRFWKKNMPDGEYIRFWYNKTGPKGKEYHFKAKSCKFISEYPE